MATYRMRAECMADVAAFASKVFCPTMMIEREHPYPDVTVTFVCELELVDILLIIKGIPDGHVMYETLELAEDYSGIRKFGRA